LPERRSTLVLVDPPHPILQFAIPAPAPHESAASLLTAQWLTPAGTTEVDDSTARTSSEAADTSP
jgi:hypothetical protein